RGRGGVDRAARPRRAGRRGRRRADFRHRPRDAVNDGPLIYIVAGEPSGDVLGAQLMAALRQRTVGRVRFAGIGGEAMAALGLESRVPLAVLAVMGVAE